MYLNPYQEIILPTLYVEGNISIGDEEDNKTSTLYKETVKIGPLAIFKDTKFLNYLSFDEEKYLNIIRNTSKKSIITMPYNGGNITFELYNIKGDIKSNIKKNEIILNITGKAKTYETVSNANIESVSEVKEIQKEFNSYLEKNILTTFDSIRSNYNTDIFNFRDTYYRSNPKYLKKHYNNWYEDGFLNLKLKVKAKIILYEKGKIKEEIRYVKENR